MKVFTFYSESHVQMFEDWFKKTLPDDVELVCKEIPQECSSGNFEADGWMRSMYRKVDYIIECCKEEKEIFVHSDCDIQFFRSFKDEILKGMEDKGLDLLAQRDIPGPVCCGFMAIRPSQKMADLFGAVKTVMREHNINDQHSLNHLLNSGADVKLGVLDERYYSVWRSLNPEASNNLNSVWHGMEPLNNIPKDIVMHHANFIVGVDLKVKCMDVVRQKVTSDE